MTIDSSPLATERTPTDTAFWFVDEAPTPAANELNPVAPSLL